MSALKLDAEDPSACLLVLPSDHVLGDKDRFLDAIDRGYVAAMAGALVTFAMKAVRPETGYGYIRQGKPLADCAMFSLEGQVTTIIPGQTPCLACIYPEDPTGWKREFPVFGAVSAMAACAGAMEGIKLLSGMGAALTGKMLYYDLRAMRFYTLPIQRRPDCPVCGHL